VCCDKLAGAIGVTSLSGMPVVAGLVVVHWLGFT